MSDKSKALVKPLPLWKNCVVSGLSGMVASAATNPIDVLKVRLQLMDKSQTIGFFGTVGALYQEGGLLAFMKGLSASLLRQATYTSTRLGTYEPLKQYVLKRVNSQKDDEEKQKDLSFGQKMAVGSIAGAFGSTIGSPCDLVLVRMQADGRLPAELRRNYSSVLDGIFRIIREEGFFALWKGCLPNIQRAMALNAVQIGVFDEAKKRLQCIPQLKGNTMATHFSATLLSGFLATLVTSPFDVAKTRLMNQSKAVAGGGVLYKGTFDCLRKTIQSEGFSGLYRGFWPNYIRLAPHTTIVLMTFEYLKKQKIVQNFGCEKNKKK